MSRQVLVPVLATIGALLVGTAPAEATFPGPNGRIAFGSTRTGPSRVLIRVPGNALDLDAVTFSGTGANSDPAWSPEGQRLAFVSDRTGNYDIFKVNVDILSGGNSGTNLTSAASYDADPAWSPDGTRIAFASDRAGDFDIFTMNSSDGSNVSPPLTTVPQRDGFPAWSPDGSKIAFESERDGNLEVYVMNADGTNQTRLTNDPGADNSPSWSPDGTKIAFHTTRAGDDDIATMNADGTGVSVTHAAGTNEFWPAWSPDGTRIAFQTNRGDGIYRIWAMRADGTGTPTQVSDGPSDATPDWQRSYDSPSLADSLVVSIVPNFRQTVSSSQCSARGGLNSTHGAPDIPGGTNPDSSCNPPAFVAGTTAHLGNRAVGSLSLSALTGDIGASFSLSDVRAGSPTGPDYDPSTTSPDLTVVSKVRISDQQNCPGGACGATSHYTSATVIDADVGIPVPCFNTSDPTIGSNCNAVGSLNAAIPIVVVSDEQNIFQMFRIRVNDSGADGIRGNADDRAFAQQGIYVP